MFHFGKKKKEVAPIQEAVAVSPTPQLVTSPTLPEIREGDMTTSSFNQQINNEERISGKVSEEEKTAKATTRVAIEEHGDAGSAVHEVEQPLPLGDKRYEKIVKRSLEGFAKCLIVHNQYEPGYLWIELPKADLYKTDLKARYLKPLSIPKRIALCVLGLVAGGVVGFASTFLGLVAYGIATQHIIQGGLLLSAYGAGLCGVLGIGLGIQAIRISPKETWYFRLKPIADVATGEIAGSMLEPIVPAALLQHYAGAGEAGKPMAIRGSVMYNVAQQAWIKRLFRHKADQWQKMTYTALVVMALVVLFSIIVWTIALKQGTTPGVDNNGQQTQQQTK